MDPVDKNYAIPKTMSTQESIFTTIDKVHSIHMLELFIGNMIPKNNVNLKVTHESIYIPYVLFTMLYR